MMAKEKTQQTLLERMPAVRGRMEANVALARFTWFKVGGPADILFSPEDEADLAQFMAKRPLGVPVTVIGLSSNLMIRDGGVRGVVIRLGRNFSRITVDGEHIIAGAGAADINVARKAEKSGLSGFAFLSGIPGCVGGAVVMNAGAYGSEVSKVIETVNVIDGSGNSRTLNKNDLNFSYRHADLAENMIVTAATFKGRPGDRAAIAADMAEIQSLREQTQPVRSLTGGSTFKNPEGYKAWQLIEAAGCRGLIRGGAEVSNLHCNFLINGGGATAADIEGLGEDVRRRVKEKTGITLEWEIHIIGDVAPTHIFEVTS